jgi:hypothetical protein
MDQISQLFLKINSRKQSIPVPDLDVLDIFLGELKTMPEEC